MKGQILLILKTPPPFGGGEIRALALKKYLGTNTNYRILEISSKKLNKATQGRFALWKFTKFIKDFSYYSKILFLDRPKLVFMSLPKSFFPFLRDSCFIWMAILFKIPCVAELAGMSFYFLHGSKVRKLYGVLVLKKLKSLRVLGFDIAQEFNKIGVEQTYVSDNGVLIEKSLSYHVLGEDGYINILFVGTHSLEKGFLILLKAIETLKQKGYCFRLFTIGEWRSQDFREKAIKYIDDNSLDKYCFLNGAIFDKKKWDFYSKSQILVLPSYREGQPLVVLEALGFGIPVIATRVGAIPDTIQHGKNGFLIEPGSSNELVQYLEILMSDTELRRTMSLENRSLYMKRYTQKKYLESIENWLQKCSLRESV